LGVLSEPLDQALLGIDRGRFFESSGLVDRVQIQPVDVESGVALGDPVGVHDWNYQQDKLVEESCHKWVVSLIL
jgi:hypothetical protein